MVVYPLQCEIVMARRLPLVKIQFKLHLKRKQLNDSCLNMLDERHIAKIFMGFERRKLNTKVIEVLYASDSKSSNKGV